jgi:hypothetical protein
VRGIDGRPKDSHALPPRRKSSIQRTGVPPFSGQPLLPGANASWRGCTAKLPSLTTASRVTSPMRTRTVRAPRGADRMVVLRLP